MLSFLEGTDTEACERGVGASSHNDGYNIQLIYFGKYSTEQVKLIWKHIFMTTNLFFFK